MMTGVPAVIGMYSAIFPLFAYALFGSSRQLMVGPDAATCMMMAAAVAPLADGDPQRYMALVTAMTSAMARIRNSPPRQSRQSMRVDMPRRFFMD